MWREARHLLLQLSPSSFLREVEVPTFHREQSSDIFHSGHHPRPVAPLGSYQVPHLVKYLLKGGLLTCIGMSRASRELSVSGLQKIADDGENLQGWKECPSFPRLDFLCFTVNF